MQNRLVRTNHDKVLAGVCGGLAQYFGIDSTIVRLIFVLSVFILHIFNPLIYIILWVIMPLDTQASSIGSPAALPHQEDPTGEWRYDPYTGEPVERKEKQF